MVGLWVNKNFEPANLKSQGSPWIKNYKSYPYNIVRLFELIPWALPTWKRWSASWLKSAFNWGSVTETFPARGSLAPFSRINSSSSMSSSSFSSASRSAKKHHDFKKIHKLKRRLTTNIQNIQNKVISFARKLSKQSNSRKNKKWFKNEKCSQQKIIGLDMSNHTFFSNIMTNMAITEKFCCLKIHIFSL